MKGVLKRLSMACLDTLQLPSCSMSILYSDKEGLFWALQKKIVSKNAFGEIEELRFLNPDAFAIDSRCSADTNFDR